MRSVSKLFKRQWKVFVLAFLILLAEAVFFSIISEPSSPLYSIRKTGLSILVAAQPTHKAKAKLYLAEAVHLQGHVDMLLKDRSSDEELKDAAWELMAVEQSAITEMDLASKAEGDIKQEVEVLCDTLIKQQLQLKQAIVKTQKIATLPFEQYANLTKILLDESPGW
jgi:hypothetical protein